MDYAIHNTRGNLLGKKVVSSNQRTDVQLAQGELFRLEGDQRGMLVKAMDGRAWLTQNGDNQDILLEKGEMYRINRSGRVVIQGWPSAQVSFSKP